MLTSAALACSVALRRNESGICAATLGIDLAAVCAAPLSEGVRVDVYPDGRMALSPQPDLRLLDAPHKGGIAVVKGIAVFHDLASNGPLGLAEKGDGNAL